MADSVDLTFQRDCDAGMTAAGPASLLDRADAVETVESCLFWKDWTRYSSRQQTSMQLGGLQGSIRYRGCLEAFLPFLELAAAAVHIGKQTSFGPGQMSFAWIFHEEDTCCPVR
ncbi:MAG: CRISPR system precrRNA processing endoribonuclease RAMP protein Cas6 [Desulfovibrionaceae bacterium]